MTEFLSQEGQQEGAERDIGTSWQPGLLSSVPPGDWRQLCCETLATAVRDACV